MKDDHVQRTRYGLSCFSEQLSLSELLLLDAQKAAELAAVFETLANDTRLRALNVIAQSVEASPTELAGKLRYETSGYLESIKASFRPRNHRAQTRRQSSLLPDCRPLCNRPAWNAAYGLHKTQSFARKPGESGALLSVSWSRRFLQMVVNFEIRALREAGLEERAAAIQDIKSKRK